MLSKNTKLENELSETVEENTKLTAKIRELRAELKSIYDSKMQLGKGSDRDNMSKKEQMKNAEDIESSYKLRYEQLMEDYHRLKSILDQ